MGLGIGEHTVELEHSRDKKSGREKVAVLATAVDSEKSTAPGQSV